MRDMTGTPMSASYSDGPALTWFPVRLIRAVVAGEVSLREIATDATALGFRHIELHEAMVPSERAAADIRAMLCGEGLDVSQLTAGTDFANPAPEARRRSAEEARRLVAVAATVGASNIRVVSGIERQGVSVEDGIRWAVEGLVGMGEIARGACVSLRLENHYRDRMWSEDEFDFAREPDVWLRLLAELPTDSVSVNFDTAQPMVVRADPVGLLERVIERVGYVHAGDRLWGRREHSALGEGDVDFFTIFHRLARAGYRGYISREDAEADSQADVARGLDYLRNQIEDAWGAVL
jgi:sugar phosphate isomerase/epimerase